MFRTGKSIRHGMVDYQLPAAGNGNDDSDNRHVGDEMTPNWIVMVT